MFDPSRVPPGVAAPLRLVAPLRAVCFDWGGTLMAEAGPEDTPMGQWPQVAAVPGAAACLAALPPGLPLCIATNASVSGRASIERALDRVGFLGYFSEVFCYSELGVRKSEPAFWQAVQQRLGVPLEAIAMVGDSLEQDCLAPRRFGVQGVWFDPHGQSLPERTSVPRVQHLVDFANAVTASAKGS
jgi:FMN phosphatase YigB (HAD superfamily)